MPEARLQRTREAQPELADPISLSEQLDCLSLLFPIVRKYLLVTDAQGYTHREYLPDVFVLRESD